MVAYSSLLILPKELRGKSLSNSWSVLKRGCMKTVNIWNQDTCLKAWNYASKIHKGQLLPGSDIPYINHLGLVAMEAMAALSCDDDINDPNLLVLCTLLHDSIEDTSLTYNEIKEEFGEKIANGVSALTKDKKLSSKIEQMKDSIARIKQQPKEVWMVKLCDRITNLQPPPKHWNDQKITRYREEACFILEQLGEASHFPGERLQMKIDGYSRNGIGRTAS